MGVRRHNHRRRTEQNGRGNFFRKWGGTVDLGYSCDPVLYDGEVTINDGSSSSDSLWTPQESVPPETLTITIDGTTYEDVPRGGSNHLYSYGDGAFNDYPFYLSVNTPNFPWPEAKLSLPNSGTYDVKIQAIGSASVSTCFKKAVETVAGDVLFVDVTSLPNQTREMSVTYAEIRSALKKGSRVVARDGSDVGIVTGASTKSSSNHEVYVGIVNDFNNYRLLTFKCTNEEDKPVKQAD